MLLDANKILVKSSRENTVFELARKHCCKLENTVFSQHHDTRKDTLSTQDAAADVDPGRVRGGAGPAVRADVWPECEALAKSYGICR